MPRCSKSCRETSSVLCKCLGCVCVCLKQASKQANKQTKPNQTKPKQTTNQASKQTSKERKKMVLGCSTAQNPNPKMMPKLQISGRLQNLFCNLQASFNKLYRWFQPMTSPGISLRPASPHSWPLEKGLVVVLRFCAGTEQLQLFRVVTKRQHQPGAYFYAKNPESYEYVAFVSNQSSLSCLCKSHL